MAPAIVYSSLVNTPPITNNKEKQVHSSHRGTKYTWAAYALANLLQNANSGSNCRLSSEQVGGTECSFVCHVSGLRGISLGYFFAAAVHRLNVFLRRRAPADLSIACPLSC